MRKLVGAIILFLLLISPAAGEIAGEWQTVTSAGVVGVEFGGCLFSPCVKNSGIVKLNGEDFGATYFKLANGVVVVKDNATGDVIAEGVVDPDETIISVAFGGEIYTLLRTPAE